MVPERAGAASASVDASVTPTYEVREPSDVSVSGRGATCTVRWRGNGEHDGFNVSLEGFQPVTLGENATSHDFTLSEWQRCGTATVTQTLLGNTGPAASGSSDYVYAVPAKLDGLWVEWDDANTVTIHGYDFDTWGQEATFTLTINGKEYAVAAGQPTVSVKDLPVPDDDRDRGCGRRRPGRRRRRERRRRGRRPRRRLRMDLRRHRRQRPQTGQRNVRSYQQRAPGRGQGGTRPPSP